MHAADGTSPHTAAWFVEPDPVGASLRGRKGSHWPDDATSARAVIVSTLFLGLFTAALLIGGHAAVDPLLRMAIAARNTVAVGDVVLPMPDGMFCRHLSFDNATAEMNEGAVAPCPDDIVRGQFHRPGGRFTWGEH